MPFFQKSRGKVASSGGEVRRICASVIARRCFKSALPRLAPSGWRAVSPRRLLLIAHLGPLRSLQFCEQPLHKLLIGSEVRLTKAIERDTSVQESVLRGVREDAQRSHDGEVPLLRLASSIPVVHQQRVGRELDS